MPHLNAQIGAVQLGDTRLGSPSSAFDQTLTGSAGLSTLAFGSGGRVDLVLVGSAGLSTLAFGAGGALLQDLPLAGLIGFSTLFFGSNGSVIYDQDLLGSVGFDALSYGAGGVVFAAGYPIDGIVGVDLLVFGSDGSVFTSTQIRGVRGLRSSLQFGFGGLVSVDYGQIKEYKRPWVVSDTQVVFRTTNAGRNARHVGAETVDLLNGDPSFIAPWRSVRISPAKSDRLITVGTGEQGRLDIIALNYYNDSRLWWVLALANDIFNPFEEPLAGDRIRVPSLQRVQSFLGEVSTGQEVSRFRPV